MAEIINELPDEEEMTGGEVEVNLEEKESKPEKSTADVERVEHEPKQEELFEVEEEDDTPVERSRKRTFT